MSVSKETIQLEIIGRVHSCYPEKFGIPRQPGLVKSSSGRIELFPPFNRQEMTKGVEGFSHIWVQFLFHQAMGQGWQATVRPPWLGGQKRVGVFASRSPHRPNHLGMSAVRLNGIVKEKKQVFLDIAEHDLLDKTPVVDIKPYISYSDSVEGAASGFVRFSKDSDIQVELSDTVEKFCLEYEAKTSRKLARLIRETLNQDPRPAYQRNKIKEYGMSLWDVNIRWQARGNCFRVYSITSP